MGPACQWRGAHERLSGTLWVGPASREWSGGVRGELSRAGLSTVAGWAEAEQAGLRSGEGKSLGRAGPCGEEEKEDWAGTRVEHGLGCLRDWARLLKGLGFLFTILFYFKTPHKLFEFKFKFEFNPSTQTNKTMRQHECTNKFNLEKI